MGLFSDNKNIEKILFIATARLMFVEEGDRRQLYWRQEENYMGIVNDLPLRVYAPPSNFEHRVDGGVLNPQRKWALLN
ncbi:hypothetical protein [Okeania sp. SIO2C2]|uniref:hypothetical protein n=1 Tax=Okeania sp. SIO2C2 TaxID=2607787 RepID=UPI00257EDC8F|nr:hypothetical protein [Okeania sp. SIO2C2]